MVTDQTTKTTRHSTTFPGFEEILSSSCHQDEKKEFSRASSGVSFSATRRDVEGGPREGTSLKQGDEGVTLPSLGH